MQQHRHTSSTRPRAQNTPAHRAPLHPLPYPSSSLNPSVVVVHKPVNSLPGATFHRFRRFSHRQDPATAPVKPRANDALTQPDSPPASPSAPRQPHSQRDEPQRDHAESSQGGPKVAPSPDLDHLKPTSIRSPLARRSAAVQTSLPLSPVQAAPRTARFTTEPAIVSAEPAVRGPSPEASSSSSSAAKIKDSVRAPPSPYDVALAASIQPTPGTRTRSRPSSFPRLSTAHLSPFQRHLGTDRDVYVELLSSGELVVDSRTRESKAGAPGQDEVYLFSGDGNEMSVFHPASTLSTSVPLVLLHPSTTYARSDLIAVASSPSSANSTQQRHAKAYRTAARIVAALRARVPLMSFYHPSPPLALADRVKVVVYADLESYACSATVGDGQTRGLATAVVCPSRDSLVLSLPGPPAPASAPTATSSTSSITSRITLTLYAFTSPASSVTAARTLLPPDLPPDARALAHCAAAPSTLTLVERVRAAHLGALVGSSGPSPVEGEPPAGSATRGPSAPARRAPSSQQQQQGADSSSSSEACVVRALARTLGVAPPSPARGRTAGSSASASSEGRGAAAASSSSRPRARGGDVDKRCLPGLGWVLREGGSASSARTALGKAEEEGDEAVWRVLFADGEELRVRLRQRRDGTRAGSGGRSGMTGEGGGERDEVELQWRGERYLLQRDDLPTRLVRRLPLALELLALFLPAPPAPP